MNPALHAATLVAAGTDALPMQWLIARASGLLAYVLLTAAVVAGLTLRTRILGRAVPPPVVTTVHRSLSLIGLAAVALHGVLLWLDTQVDLSTAAMFLPGSAGYRPTATGLGVIAAELWLLVHLSFRLRSRIGVAQWRALHVLTIPLWGMAAAHGVLAGSDSAIPWVRDLYVGSIGVVAFLLAIRLAMGASRGTARPARPARPTPSPSITRPREHTT